MSNIDALKKKTKTGLLWNSFEKISVKVASFILNIVLARLLTPHDYGVIGLLSVFIAFSNIFMESGFLKGLIQKKDRTEIDFSTTFVFNLVISIIIYLILFFLAPVVASFYDNPKLVMFERVLFISIILNALTIVPSARLQINIDFKKIAIINLISIILSGTCGIICAHNGLGPWALIFQNLIYTLSLVFLYWTVGKWIPKLKFSWDSFNSLFKFSSKLLITGILSTAILNVYNLFIGKKYDSSSLGYYTRAQQFPDVTLGTLASVLNSSTFPLMSSLQNDQSNLFLVFKKMIKLTSMLIFPSMLGLAAISNTLIIVLLTDKWTVSAGYLFWLSLSYMFAPLEILNLNLLNAIGRSDLNLKLDLIKVPIIIISMIITFPISIKAIVIGKAAFAFIYYLIDCIVTYHLFKLGPIKQLLWSWKAILSSIIMFLILIIVNTLMVNENLIKLLMQLFIGIAVYCICMFFLKDEEFISFVKKFKNKNVILR